MRGSRLVSIGSVRRLWGLCRYRGQFVWVVSRRGALTPSLRLLPLQNFDVLEPVFNE